MTLEDELSPREKTHGLWTWDPLVAFGHSVAHHYLTGAVLAVSARRAAAADAGDVITSRTLFSRATGRAEFCRRASRTEELVHMHSV